MKLLFIINPVAGGRNKDWTTIIKAYFKLSDYKLVLYILSEKSGPEKIDEQIAQYSPDVVVAVGGDGTVKMVAECLLQKNIVLGILPAGSANGLAKELGISEDPSTALDVIVNGVYKKIHAVDINDQLCIHLADIGLNAYAIKKFETQQGRGMWGYLKASVKVLWKNPVMEVKMQLDAKTVTIKAEIIVVANGSKYGSGAVINPLGKLDDTMFEVIAVKKLSLAEMFKMKFSHGKYDPEKTEIFQTQTLHIQSVKKVHFQVDGEYLGMVNDLQAKLIPAALNIIVPKPGYRI